MQSFAAIMLPTCTNRLSKLVSLPRVGVRGLRQTEGLNVHVALLLRPFLMLLNPLKTVLRRDTIALDAED